MGVWLKHGIREQAAARSPKTAGRGLLRFALSAVPSTLWRASARLRSRPSAGGCSGKFVIEIEPGMDEAGRTLGTQLAAVEEEEPGRLEEGQLATRGLEVQDYGGTLTQAVDEGSWRGRHCARSGRRAACAMRGHRAGCSGGEMRA